MPLIILLLISYPVGAQLPSKVILDSVYSGQNSTHSIVFKPATDIEIENVQTGCGCTGVEFPTGVLKAGEEYHLKVDVNTAELSGSFKSQVAVKIAGEDSLWALSLQVQAVPPFPAEIDLGEIDFITLPLERHLSLAQIADQPAIDVDGHRVGAGAVELAVVHLESEPRHVLPDLAPRRRIGEVTGAEPDQGLGDAIARAHGHAIELQRAPARQRHDLQRILGHQIEVGVSEQVVGVRSHRHRLVGGRGRELEELDRDRAARRPAQAWAGPKKAAVKIRFTASDEGKFRRPNKQLQPSVALEVRCS